MMIKKNEYMKKISAFLRRLDDVTEAEKKHFAMIILVIVVLVIGHSH